MSFWNAPEQPAVNISFEFDDELPSFELKEETCLKDLLAKLQMN